MTAVGQESLRETPETKPSWRRRHRWRLVPLILLIAAAIAATVAGLVWRSQQTQLGEGVIQPTAGPAAPLDASACAPRFDGPESDPWAEDPEAALAAWDAQAGGLGGYFVEGDDGHVLLGEPHWSNISQAVGREQLTPAHVEAWDGYLSNMRADLEAQGRQLFVVVAPAKWEIVPEALPDAIEALRGPGHFAQLQSELPDVPWVDVRAALAEEQRRTPLYSRLNSHWSDYAASVAFSQIAACMGATEPSLADMPALPISGATMVPDRNEFEVAGLSRTPGLDWAEPAWTEPAAPMAVVGPDGAERAADAREVLLMSDLPASTSTPTAPVEGHVLLVRDSTGDQLAPMFQAQFTETTQIRASLEEPAGMPDVPAEARAADADVVVLLIAQRYLQVVPGVERE